jgi:hypothetical protein
MHSGRSKINWKYKPLQQSGYSDAGVYDLLLSSRSLYTPLSQCLMLTSESPRTRLEFPGKFHE